MRINLLGAELIDFLFSLVYYTRMEMEADYIGMLLMASAGYDPRIAPKVYEKLGKMDMDWTEKYYFSTHPYGKMRAQLLSQAKVMEEAMTLYWEAKAGRGIQGFL